LARRSLGDPTQVAYYVGSGPPDTSLEQLVRVVGARWAIEESFKTAKGEVGLDHNEVRRWHAWYRLITLALFSHAYLTVLCAAVVGTRQPRKKREGAGKLPAGAEALIPLTVSEVRRLLWRLVWGRLPVPDQVCR
jgi:SRSO17 transposase